MKKFISLLSASAFLVVAGGIANAQTDGQFIFQTFEIDSMTGAPKSDHLIFQTDGTTRAFGPNIVARVYAGSTADFSAMMAQGPGAVALLPSGTGGEGFVEATSQANGGLIGVSGTVPGNSVFYSIAAWDSTTGSTFDSATIRGNSTPVSIDLGGTPAVGAAIPVLNVNTFASFQLQDVAMVPEPSTVALGIIGGLALLMRRRRS